VFCSAPTASPPRFAASYPTLPRHCDLPGGERAPNERGRDLEADR
jgi:hypothetical protein